MIIISRYLNLANVITILGLLSALSSIHCSLNGWFSLALIFIVIAGVCDLLDGLVARKTSRTQSEKQFGAELDSLVDVSSFCIAPALFVYSLAHANSSVEIWLLLVCSYYVIMGTARLAHFNSHGLEHNLSAATNKAYYTGLPVTFAALLIPCISVLTVLVEPVYLLSILTASLFIIGTLFVLDIKIPKPSGLYYPFLLVLAAAVIWASLVIDIA